MIPNTLIVIYIGVRLAASIVIRNCRSLWSPTRKTHKLGYMKFGHRGFSATWPEPHTLTKTIITINNALQYGSP